jgi:phytoene dehydrogenase-like protein
LHSPLSASVGLALTAAGHAHGWPVAEGGSQAVSTALAGLLRSLGGTIETGRPIASLDELPASRVVLLDVSPRAALGILGERLPPRIARAYRRYRYGPGAFKLDLAVEGGIPWAAGDVSRAGTVHIGGTLEEIARAERDVAAGRMPEQPFVLVGQQDTADPGRAAGDLRPVWTYAHVPAGYDGDASEAILRQLERFAPGVRDRIRARFTRSPADMAGYNSNYVGGDIATGANDPVQVLFRPRPSLRPYATGVPGVFLCSAATPPGAGVHGMCGHNAARAALASLDRRP